MIKIGESYGITFDKLNFVLNEKYEKRLGKGRDAPLSGEFGWREISFHDNWEGIVNKIEKLELAKGVKDVKYLENIEVVVRIIENLKKEMAEMLRENIKVGTLKGGD